MNSKLVLTTLLYSIFIYECTPIQNEFSHQKEHRMTSDNQGASFGGSNSHGSKKMPIQLYYTVASPPSRAVQLTLESLQIPYEIKEVNLSAGEHLNEDFLKLNPQHTVPVIKDDNFVLSESHAIMLYLVNHYKNGNSLYPTNSNERAIVDHRLYFDSGTLFPALKTIPVKFLREKTITGLTAEIVAQYDDCYSHLEKFLGENNFIAGKQLTIADYSILNTLSYMGFFYGVDSKRFPATAAYFERALKDIPRFAELHNAAIAAMKTRYAGFNHSLPK